MANATGSRKQVAYIAEVTFNVTPTTPQTQVIEFVDFKAATNAPLLTDPSLRSDRQISFARRGNDSIQGDIEVVMCAANFDEFVEAAFQGTWSTNVLKIGQTQRSFSIEEGFTDLAQFHAFTGCVFDTMTMDVTVDKLVTTKFAFIGASETAFSGTSLDVTPTAITSKPKFYHVGGTFKEGGSTVAYLSAISWTLKNNATASNALGVSGVRAITSGKVEVTGKVTALFEDVVMYNKFKNNTDTILEYTLTDATNTHTYFFPKVKYVMGMIQGNGDGPLTVEVEFTAVYDTSTATTLRLTRV
jgi:hypothetical protein